jgi:hypothetical protein
MYKPQQGKLSTFKRNKCLDLGVVAHVCNPRHTDIMQSQQKALRQTKHHFFNILAKNA